VEVADEIWKTCCAFHNLLLEVDGLSLEWTKELGMHDEIDVRNNVSNFADLSGMGPGDDIVRKVTMEAAIQAMMSMIITFLQCASFVI
jgi:hypothetical protein